MRMQTHVEWSVRILVMALVGALTSLMLGCCLFLSSAPWVPPKMPSPPPSPPPTPPSLMPPDTESVGMPTAPSSVERRRRVRLNPAGIVPEGDHDLRVGEPKEALARVWPETRRLAASPMAQAVRGAEGNSICFMRYDDRFSRYRLVHGARVRARVSDSTISEETAPPVDRAEDDGLVSKDTLVVDEEEKSASPPSVHPTKVQSPAAVRRSPTLRPPLVSLQQAHDKAGQVLAKARWTAAGVAAGVRASNDKVAGSKNVISSAESEREILADEMVQVVRKILAVANGYKRQVEELQRAAKAAGFDLAGGVDTDDVEEDVLRAGKAAEPTPALPPPLSPTMSTVLKAIKEQQYSSDPTDGIVLFEEEMTPGRSILVPPIQILRRRRIWLGAIFLMLTDFWCIVGFAMVTIYGLGDQQIGTGR